MASPKRLLQLFAMSGMLKFSNIALGLLSTIILARILPVEEVGRYSLYISIATVLAVPASMGVPEVLVRETARLQMARRSDLLRGLLVWAGRIIATTTLLILIGLSLWAAFTGGESDARLVPLAIIGALIPLSALNASRGAVLIGLRATIQGQLPESVIRPAVFILLLIVVSESIQLSSSQVIFLYTCATLTSFAAGSWLLSRALPSPVLKSETDSNLEERRRWTRSALPLALISGMYVITQQIDILLLGVLAEDSEVGVYRVVSLMSFMVIVGQQFVRSIVAPRFASAWHAQNLRELELTAVLASRVSLLVAVVVAVSYLFFGKWALINIFGSAYQAGFIPLMILTSAQLVSAATGSIGNLLNMCGLERLSLVGLGAGLVANIVLGVMLIPKFGAVGASIGTLVGVCVWNGILWQVVRTRLLIKPTAFGI